MGPSWIARSDKESLWMDIIGKLLALSLIDLLNDRWIDDKFLFCEYIGLLGGCFVGQLVN